MNREGEHSNAIGQVSVIMLRSKAPCAFFLISMFLLSVQSPIMLADSEISETSGRAQTTWSGSVVLNNHYTIPVTDELVISPCTNVTMSNGVRIYVEGRITVEGTSTCPVYFDYSGGGDHMGLQFNSSSNGRGSKIDNASIIHSTYGITVYQEQVMLLSQKLGDFTKGEADILRKAMGKKQKEVLDKMKPKFLINAKNKGLNTIISSILFKNSGLKYCLTFSII